MSLDSNGFSFFVHAIFFTIGFLMASLTKLGKLNSKDRTGFSSTLYQRGRGLDWIPAWDSHLYGVAIPVSHLGWNMWIRQKVITWCFSNQSDGIFVSRELCQPIWMENNLQKWGLKRVRSGEMTFEMRMSKFFRFAVSFYHDCHKSILYFHHIFRNPQKKLGDCDFEQ